jgi:hypothetical protein
MADTTNATYDGGIYVPHECLSGANIERISVSSKDFSNFNKNKGAQVLKTCVPYVLSYYNNYVSLPLFIIN